VNAVTSRGTDQASAAVLSPCWQKSSNALIVANHFLETELENLRAAVSPGYARGLLPRDRKDWYD